MKDYNKTKKDNENYEIFGKAIPQLIHDIRNPLNIVIGFSSLIQMEDSINDEIRNYLKKIYQAGISIEQILSNIDLYIMGIDELEKDYFDVYEELELFLKSKEDIISEKKIYVKILEKKEGLKINFSPEIFKRILENIFYFSLKGFKNSKLKEIFINIKKESNNEKDILTIYYSDTTDIIPTNSSFFTLDEILSNKRGLGLIFLEKFIQYAEGDIRYLYSSNWYTVAKDLNIPTDHGFIITIPNEKF